MKNLNEEELTQIDKEKAFWEGFAEQIGWRLVGWSGMGRATFAAKHRNVQLYRDEVEALLSRLGGQEQKPTRHRPDCDFYNPDCDCWKDGESVSAAGSPSPTCAKCGKSESDRVHIKTAAEAFVLADSYQPEGWPPDARHVFSGAASTLEPSPTLEAFCKGIVSQLTGREDGWEWVERRIAEYFRSLPSEPPPAPRCPSCQSTWISVHYDSAGFGINVAQCRVPGCEHTGKASEFFPSSPAPTPQLWLKLALPADDDPQNGSAVWQLWAGDFCILPACSKEHGEKVMRALASRSSAPAPTPQTKEYWREKIKRHAFLAKVCKPNASTLNEFEAEFLRELGSLPSPGMDVEACAKEIREHYVFLPSVQANETARKGILAILQWHLGGRG